MKTKKLIALVTAACLNTPCYAGGGGAEPQGMLYLNVPFGAASSRDQTTSFGFMLRQKTEATPVQFSPLRQLPIMDLRFSVKGDQSVRILGLETYRLRANEAPGIAVQTPPPEINWWIVGGVAAVAAAVIVNDNRKSKNESTTFVCPPGTVPMPGSPGTCI